MTNQPLHIHTPGDGRGRRDVFVDGKKINRVTYADTNLGVVHMHSDPLRLNRDKSDVVCEVLRGVVEVRALAEK